MARCGICGRPLSNPKSVRKGIGPICLSKLQKDIREGKAQDRIERLKLRAHRQYSRNVKKYPLGEGETRCKNCGKPVFYSSEDACPGAYCCMPCCPYAAVSPCPQEEKKGGIVEALAKVRD